MGSSHVIENVYKSPLYALTMLCGTMFALRTACGAELWRHRYFETNFDIGLVPPCAHRSCPTVIGVYGGDGRDRRRVVTVTGHSGGTRRRDGTGQYSRAARAQAMGIDWMTCAELSQAIPPAYTELIGCRLMDAFR